ncbi:helix-turn-helix domain-containing protein [Herbaspirillum sp. RV1423]|uniref:helix-turn-helix domain-containing protein n=1 Tax=Herbaspirillum sp. RV1423 TaxID=1443993 RepID=UPI0009DD8520
MHPEDIKASIRKAGKSITIAAKDLGITPSTVSLVVSGRGKSMRVQTYISDLLGKSVAEIWPKPERIYLPVCESCMSRGLQSNDRGGGQSGSVGLTG